jgi:hypothetical protein
MKMTKHHVVLTDTSQVLIPLLLLSKIGCRIDLDVQGLKLIHPKNGEISVDCRDGTPVISEADCDMLLEELENLAYQSASESEGGPASSRIMTADEVEQQREAAETFAKIVQGAEILSKALEAAKALNVEAEVLRTLREALGGTASPKAEQESESSDPDMPELQEVKPPKPAQTDRCAKKVQFLLGQDESLEAYLSQHEANVTFLRQLKQAHAGKKPEELHMMLSQYKLAQRNIVEELETQPHKTMAVAKKAQLDVATMQVAIDDVLEQLQEQSEHQSHSSEESEGMSDISEASDIWTESADPEELEEVEAVMEQIVANMFRSEPQQNQGGECILPATISATVQSV